MNILLFAITPRCVTEFDKLVPSINNGKQLLLAYIRPSRRPKDVITIRVFDRSLRYHLEMAPPANLVALPL